MNAKINVNYIYRLNSYRVVNTLRLGYKNQSTDDVLRTVQNT